jgi:hypothetical protein
MLGHNPGQVGSREPQVLAQKRARDLPGSGLTAQPRLPHPQQFGGLGRGVEQLIAFPGRRGRGRQVGIERLLRRLAGQMTVGIGMSGGHNGLLDEGFGR